MLYAFQPRPGTFLDFEAAAVPEVAEVRRMMGQPDYYLWVQFANIEAYEDLIVRGISRLPAVSRILSHQTMRLAKGGRARRGRNIPLRPLVDSG